jgi:hypothetical protein
VAGAVRFHMRFYGSIKQKLHLFPHGVFFQAVFNLQPSLHPRGQPNQAYYLVAISAIGFARTPGRISLLIIVEKRN